MAEKVHILAYSEDDNTGDNVLEVFSDLSKAMVRFHELISYMDDEEENQGSRDSAAKELLITGKYHEEGADIRFYLMEKEVQ